MYLQPVKAIKYEASTTFRSALPVSIQNELRVHLFDACVYDSNLKCVTTTTCNQCIQAEEEWAKKWIECMEKPTYYPESPQRIQTEILSS